MELSEVPGIIIPPRYLYFIQKNTATNKRVKHDHQGGDKSSEG